MPPQAFIIPDILIWPLIMAGAAALAGLTYVLVERWEAIRDQIRRRALPLAGGLAALVLLRWLGWQYWHWMELSAKVTETEKKIQAQTEAVKTVAQVVAGLLLVYGIYLTARRIRALERQVEVSRGQLETAQEEQVTERFTRAIEQLGSEKMEVRLGGIYALERIAKDSDKDYWTIMEVLTAFIRENAPWPPKTGLPTPQSVEATIGEEHGEAAEGEETPEPQSKHKPPTDIQAALTVLGRRARRFGEREKDEKHPLNLRNTDLRGADLYESHMEWADLSGTHLEGADLRRSYMEEAYLSWAHLKGAALVRADLEAAYLVGARLEESDLLGANLKGAYLVEAHLKGANLRWVNMKEAHLLGTHLERAILNNADLEGAALNGAHMQGAELIGVNLREANLLGTNLEGAVLRGSDLDGALLEGTHLKGADLRSSRMVKAKLVNVHLEGADLRGATGLTREQLAGAILDENTKLPDYLTGEREEEPGEPETPAYVNLKDKRQE